MKPLRYFLWIFGPKTNSRFFKDRTRFFFSLGICALFFGLGYAGGWNVPWHNHPVAYGVLLVALGFLGHALIGLSPHAIYADSWGGQAACVIFLAWVRDGEPYFHPSWFLVLWAVSFLIWGGAQVASRYISR